MNPLRTLESLYARIPGLRWIAALSKPAVRVAVAAAVALLAVLLLAWILVGLLPLVPVRFWQLAALCLAAFGVLWWFLVGARRYSRRGFSRKRIGDLGPGNPEDEREPLARMQAAIAEAKRTIARSPEMGRGRDPLYRVPWVLFVGDRDANVPGLLQAAGKASPFPAPASDDAQLWRWWFHKAMIAIEMHPRVVCEPGARLERGLWYQALTLLRAERDKLALNGIVACVSARTLLAGGEPARAAGIRLRRLVDEAMEHLQLRLPVYFLVTGLEEVPGYAQFRAALPTEAFDQALGFRLPENEAVSAASSARVDEILDPIVERLHALRLGALRAQGTVQQRRGTFEFVQAFPRMAAGLRALVAQMLEDNPFQRTPRWRGLYFAGAADGAHPAGAFVSDLFARFLPADQPLATPSARGSGGRMTGAALGVATMLGLSAVLSHGLSTAYRDDTALRARTQVACQEPRGAGAGGRIAWVAACGRTIQQLEAATAGTSLGFGLRRADRDIEQLKQRVVQDFSRLILAPYDQMLEADLARSGGVGIGHALAVAQRLRLLDGCRRQRAACADEAKHNVVFDPDSRLFAPFQSGESDVRVDRERAAALFDTYLGYLRWQRRGALDDEQRRLEQEFGQVLARYRPRAEDFEAWAARRRPALTLQAFWLPRGRVVGAEPGSLPSIPGAYTREAWEGVVAPWLDTVRERQPARAAVADAFRGAYFAAWFRAWGAFQARFSEGAGFWKGGYDQLAARAAGRDNPYRFFFDTARRHLSALPLKLDAGVRWGAAWDEARADWLRGWRPIGRFVGGTVSGWLSGIGADPRIEPPPWLPAMLASLRTVEGEQRPLFAKAYLQLEADAGGQESYQLVSAFFQARGRPADGPAADYAQLLAAVEKPDKADATRFTGADMAAWSVVQGPARLLLLLTVQRAADHVQARWKQAVADPVAALPPPEQVAALYGEQGKLNAFVDDWLGPFLTERERTPVKVAGIAFPLSTAFKAMVAGKGRFASLLGQTRPFMAGSFAFTGASGGGGLREAPEGTVLEIDCGQRVYRAVSGATTGGDARARVSVVWSPDACIEARVRIFLAPPDALDAAMQGGTQAAAATPPAGQAPPSPPPAEPAVALLRIYPGPEGFRQLVEDFSTGQKHYAVPELQDAYTPEQWQQAMTRLGAPGFDGVTVRLQADPSDELLRYFAASEQPAGVPASIVE